MKKAVLIINPSSGGEKAKDYETLVIKKLTTIFDDIEIKYTQKAEDATNLAKEACQKKAHSIFGMGGDGTVSEIIGGIATEEHKPVFGFFPLGTVNDLARVLNISLDPEKAIEELDIEKTKKIDIGRINDKFFMNVVAIGAIPNALNEVESEDKTKFGKFAYYFAGIKEFINMNFYNLRLTIDNSTVNEISTSLLLIGLTNSIGGHENLLPDAKVDDNVMHIIYIKDSNIIDTIKAIPEMLSGVNESSNNVEYITCKSIKVEMLDEDTNISVNVDGDEGRQLPVSVEILPSHLEVYC